jgi:gliding motility-associated-like protein
MKKDKLHTTDTGSSGFKLPEQASSNSFKVPDGYFEELNERILQNTLSNPVSTPVRHISLKPLYAAAASLAALCVIAGTVVFINPAIIDNVFSKPEKDTLTVQHHSSPASESNNQEEVNTALPGIEHPTSTHQNPNDNPALMSENAGMPQSGKSTSASNLPKNSHSNYSTTLPNNPTTAAINNSSGEKPLISTVKPQETSTSLRKPAAFSLGEDICSEQAVELAGPAANGLYYRWSNGAKTSAITIQKSALIWLMVSLDPSFNIFTSDTIRVSIIPAPDINIPESQTICASEPLIIYATENPSFANLYSYEWSASPTKAGFLKLNNLVPGSYAMTLKVKGCKTYSTKFEVVVNDCALSIPNVFTPNNDGFNDYFVIEGLGAYPGSQLRVFDRNGRTVYQTNNYQNNWDASGVETGSYFYTLRLNDAHKTERKGSITIYR